MRDGESLTELLERVRGGDRDAVEAMVEAVQGELRGLAGGFLGRASSDHTLQPTALVNEAWLKLFGQRNAWEGRQHFLAIAATVMRRLLADHARQKRAGKRDPGWERVTLSGADLAAPGPELDLVALNEALDGLAALNERQARVVELRFFSGMTVEEAAATLGVSRSTAEAEWRGARAWLHRELGGS